MPHPIIGRLFDGAALKSGSSRGSFLLFWHDRDGGTLADATANQPLSAQRFHPFLYGGLSPSLPAARKIASSFTFMIKSVKENAVTGVEGLYIINENA